MEKSKLYTIYGYYQPAENKWYVGRTSYSRRHRAGKDGERYLISPKFGEAIRRYGWGTFEYHILETTEDEEESYRLEQYWIEQKDSVENGYNKSTGGKWPGSGVHNSKSEEHKKKIGLANLNNPLLSCKVQQFTKDGQLIAEYPSQMEAQRQTGIKATHIGDVCMGKPKYKTAGGFVWKLANTY